jgi:hypothetical protein
LPQLVDEPVRRGGGEEGRRGKAERDTYTESEKANLNLETEQVLIL